MEMAKPECAGEIRELAKNLELFEFAPKVRTPAEYGRYMIQDSGHYEYDPNLEEFYDYERYGKLRMEKETGAFTEKGYVAYCGTLTFGGADGRTVRQSSTSGNRNFRWEECNDDSVDSEPGKRKRNCPSAAARQSR